MSSLEYNTQEGDGTKGGKVKTSIPARMDPLLMGRLFDTIGRRQMISFTFITSAP